MSPSSHPSSTTSSSTSPPPYTPSDDTSSTYTSKTLVAKVFHRKCTSYYPVILFCGY
jgi:hypothetical protein